MTFLALLALLVAAAVAWELRRALDRCDLEAAGRRAEAEQRRQAEVMAARFEEALIASEHRRTHAEGLHRAERARGDELELVLHDAVLTLQAHGVVFDRVGAAGPMKRIANHAAGPQRARSIEDADRAPRLRGEHPTDPGIAPPRIFPEVP